MSTFAVFGMTRDVALAEARKKVSTTRLDDSGQRRQLTPQEWQQACEERADKIMASRRVKQLSPLYDAPQYADQFISMPSTLSTVATSISRPRRCSWMHRGNPSSTKRPARRRLACRLTTARPHNPSPHAIWRADRVLIMSNQHFLKIHPAPLADLLSGAKTAEVRRNDRGFQVGDTVRLMEVNPDTLDWTGKPDLVRTISHIQTGYGLPDGMCVLSYGDTAQREALARVEAERDSLGQLSLERGHQRDAAQVEANELRRERNTVQAQLAEAVGLLKAIQSCDASITDAQANLIDSNIDSFLARHAQAEQQEAQGAQAGDELAAFKKWFAETGLAESWGESPERVLENAGSPYASCCVGSRWHAWQARAALAAQPAVRGAEHGQ